MKRANGFAEWAGAVERVMTRLAATCLALTVAAQILLANPALRPLLNYTHRAEGIRLDPANPSVIGPDGVLASGTSLGRASLTLRLDGGFPGCGVDVISGGETLGVLVAREGDTSRVSIDVSDGQEIALVPRNTGSAACRVIVEASSGVIHPGGGESYDMARGEQRFRVGLRRP